MSMIFYIFLYCLTGYFIPYRPDKISIFPEFSSPQFLLYPWMASKKFPSHLSLQHPYRFPYRISRRYARKYVHVIARYLHFNHFYSPRAANISLNNSFGRIPYLTIQYPFADISAPIQGWLPRIGKLHGSFLLLLMQPIDTKNTNLCLTLSSPCSRTWFIRVSFSWFHNFHHVGNRSNFKLILNW